MSELIPEELLEELLALDREATAAPWGVILEPNQDPEYPPLYAIVTSRRELIADTTAEPKNAYLTVRARNHLAGLIAALRQARAEVARLREENARLQKLAPPRAVCECGQVFSRRELAAPHLFITGHHLQGPT